MSEASIIGREKEKKILHDILASSEPEFIALYGRRRVGKTFLINQFFRNKGLYFEITGIKEADKQLQLKNFATEFEHCFGKQPQKSKPNNWVDAFSILYQEIKKSEEQHIILFFDELPWLASPRSGFLTALDHIWNRYLSRDPRVILIVCGSAASWMIKKIIHNRTGLYGRLTRQIRLLPYSLAETEKYLKSRHIYLDRKQITELYMAMGGVPKHLSQIPRGKSSAEIIQQLFFNPHSYLSGEFRHLYESLFDGAKKHVTLVQLLAQHRSGLTKNEILNYLPELHSGGGFTDLLTELEEAGFIAMIPQFGKKKKEGRYLLIDEYSLFFLTWVEPIIGPGLRTISPEYWLRQHQSPSYRSWAGYSFESLCLKHIDKIIRSLQLGVVITAYSSWRFIPKPGEPEQGAQIDLILERADRSINLCEIKFSDNAYTLTKDDAQRWQNKKHLFQQKTKTKKTLFTTLIAANGAERNLHFLAIVDQLVTIDDLFTD